MDNDSTNDSDSSSSSWVFVTTSPKDDDPNEIDFREVDFSAISALDADLQYLSSSNADIAQSNVTPEDPHGALDSQLNSSILDTSLVHIPQTEVPPDTSRIENSLSSTNDNEDSFNSQIVTQGNLQSKQPSQIDLDKTFTKNIAENTCCDPAVIGDNQKQSASNIADLTSKNETPYTETKENQPEAANLLSTSFDKNISSQEDSKHNEAICKQESRHDEEIEENTPINLNISSSTATQTEHSSTQELLQHAFNLPISTIESLESLISEHDSESDGISVITDSEETGSISEESHFLQSDPSIKENELLSQKQQPENESSEKEQLFDEHLLEKPPQSIQKPQFSQKSQLSQKPQISLKTQLSQKFLFSQKLPFSQKSQLSERQLSGKLPLSGKHQLCGKLLLSQRHHLSQKPQKYHLSQKYLLGLRHTRNRNQSEADPRQDLEDELEEIPEEERSPEPQPKSIFYMFIVYIAVVAVAFLLGQIIKESSITGNSSKNTVVKEQAFFILKNESEDSDSEVADAIADSGENTDSNREPRMDLPQWKNAKRIDPKTPIHRQHYSVLETGKNENRGRKFRAEYYKYPHENNYKDRESERKHARENLKKSDGVIDWSDTIKSFRKKDSVGDEIKDYIYESKVDNKHKSTVNGESISEGEPTSENEPIQEDKSLDDKPTLESDRKLTEEEVEARMKHAQKMLLGLYAVLADDDNRLPGNHDNFVEEQGFWSYLFGTEKKMSPEKLKEIYNKKVEKYMKRREAIMKEYNLDEYLKPLKTNERNDQRKSKSVEETKHATDSKQTVNSKSKDANNSKQANNLKQVDTNEPHKKIPLEEVKFENKREGNFDKEKYKKDKLKNYGKTENDKTSKEEIQYQKDEKLVKGQKFEKDRKFDKAKTFERDHKFRKDQKYDNNQKDERHQKFDNDQNFSKDLKNEKNGKPHRYGKDEKFKKNEFNNKFKKNEKYKMHDKYRKHENSEHVEDAKNFMNFEEGSKNREKYWKDLKHNDDEKEEHNKERENSKKYPKNYAGSKEFKDQANHYKKEYNKNDSKRFSQSRSSNRYEDSKKYENPKNYDNLQNIDKQKTYENSKNYNKRYKYEYSKTYEDSKNYEDIKKYGEHPSNYEDQDLENSKSYQFNLKHDLEGGHEGKSEDYNTEDYTINSEIESNNPVDYNDFIDIDVEDEEIEIVRNPDDITDSENELEDSGDDIGYLEDKFHLETEAVNANNQGNNLDITANLEGIKEPNNAESENYIKNEIRPNNEEEDLENLKNFQMDSSNLGAQDFHDVDEVENTKMLDEIKYYDGMVNNYKKQNNQFRKKLNNHKLRVENEEIINEQNFEGNENFGMKKGSNEKQTKTKGDKYNYDHNKENIKHGAEEESFKERNEQFEEGAQYRDEISFKERKKYKGDKKYKMYSKYKDDQLDGKFKERIFREDGRYKDGKKYKEGKKYKDRNKYEDRKQFSEYINFEEDNKYGQENKYSEEKKFKDDLKYNEDNTYEGDEFDKENVKNRQKDKKWTYKNEKSKYHPDYKNGKEYKNNKEYKNSKEHNENRNKENVKNRQKDKELTYKNEESKYHPDYKNGKEYKNNKEYENSKEHNNSRGYKNSNEFKHNKKYKNSMEFNDNNVYTSSKEYKNSENKNQKEYKSKTFKDSKSSKINKSNFNGPKNQEEKPSSYQKKAKELQDQQNYITRKQQYLLKKEYKLLKKERRINSLRDSIRLRKLKFQDMRSINNSISGEWYIQLHNGRNQIRKEETESDWLFDRAQMRNRKRKLHYYR